MRTISSLLIAALLLLPMAAAAQDDAAERDYGDAFARFFPGGTANQKDYLLSGAALIPRIEGRWTVASALFPDGQYDADNKATACERIAVEFRATGRFGFTETRLQGGAPTSAVITYVLVGGHTFIGTANAEGFLSLYGFEDADTAPFGVLASVLTGLGTQGYSQIHMVGETALVMHPLGYAPRILTRCGPG